MRLRHILPLIAALAASSAVAKPIDFDFKDPKGVNNVAFKLDAPLESISGSANGISGTISVDPAAMADLKGRLVVAVDTMTVPNPMMQGHLHGEKWLDAKKFPEITFEVKSVSKLEKKENSASGLVTGTFTLHGVSKEITVPAKVMYLPGRLKDRVPNMEGDLLVIRSEFTIQRGDYGIQPKQNEDKVADLIHITLAVAGASVKQAK